MEVKKSKKRFYLLLGSQIFILILVAIFFLVDFDSFFDDEDVVFIGPSPACDLKKGICKVELNSTQNVSLEIFPKGIPLMKPLNFIVYAKGVKTDSIKLKIYATNMQMGTHKLTLKRVSNDRFEGTQVLPTCIVGGMIWNADMTSNAFHEEKGVRFTFKTDI